LRGTLDAFLKSERYAFQALRDAVADGLHLTAALRLRRRNHLEIPAQFVHLRFQCRALPALLRTLEHQPEHKDRHKKDHADQDCVHSFSSSSTGNVLLTLLAMLQF
jgi:hypothetical protein